MPFIGDLVVKQLPVKVVRKQFLWVFSCKKTVLEWQIYEDLTYRDDKLGIIVTVVKGATTDFASIPRPFWPFLPPVGRYSKAAVVHDYCYRNGLFDRQTADLLFLHAMEELRVAKWKKFVMHKVVRVFGSKAYKERRE